jgi:hypothetical protein
VIFAGHGHLRKPRWPFAREPDHGLNAGLDDPAEVTFRVGVQHPTRPVVPWADRWCAHGSSESQRQRFGNGPPLTLVVDREENWITGFRWIPANKCDRLGIHP